MRLRRLVLAGCAAAAYPACSDPPKPKAPGPPAATDGAGGAASGLEPDEPEVPEVPQEERIAAIEHAMNELAPVANQCWAAAAADDFRLAGDVRALITVGSQAGKGAAIQITANTTGDDVLARCLHTVLAAYPWAAPLAGQALELPFHFDAPAMQNVVDRRLVPRATQNGVTVGVLLDEANSGNAALSLIDVEVTALGTVPAREVERRETWHILGGSATVRSAGGKAVTLNAHDTLLVPAEARLEVVAGADVPLRALVVITPGGREGSARAGALPGKATTMAVRARPPQPVVKRGADVGYFVAPGKGAWIVVEPPAAAGAVSLGVFVIGPAGAVPPHVHAGETEALYLLGGGGEMTVAGVTVPITADSVVQVPPGVEHSFAPGRTATAAIQIYTPAGPEQRHKKPPARAEKTPLTL